MDQNNDGLDPMELLEFIQGNQEERPRAGLTRRSSRSGIGCELQEARLAFGSLDLIRCQCEVDQKQQGAGTMMILNPHRQPLNYGNASTSSTRFLLTQKAFFMNSSQERTSGVLYDLLLPTELFQADHLTPQSPAFQGPISGLISGICRRWRIGPSSPLPRSHQRGQRFRAPGQNRVILRKRCIDPLRTRQRNDSRGMLAGAGVDGRSVVRSEGDGDAFEEQAEPGLHEQRPATASSNEAPKHLAKENYILRATGTEVGL